MIKTELSNVILDLALDIQIMDLLGRLFYRLKQDIKQIKTIQASGPPYTSY